MRCLDVKSSVYADADHTAIRCEVLFEGLPAPVPFLAMASDCEAHGAQLFVDLVAGKYGPIADFEPEEGA
ncbi:hypothetical protein V4C53_11710 [Paraburkholderia azotifigens]|uniref:hypothetical protein n=1 Tax=Paraburkholderia azotifigens TaxID=2057004 RepID=UPI00317DFE82